MADSFAFPQRMSVSGGIDRQAAAMAVSCNRKCRRSNDLSEGFA
jgi:hypothetical protein